MPKQTRYLGALLFCLCCQFAGCTWTEPASAATALHTPEGLRALLASGTPTPLDALTPYGKREAIRRMRWRDGVLVGFGHGPFIRELDHKQLAHVLRFLDAENYLPMLDKRLIGPPQRLPAPSAQVEQDLRQLQQLAEEDDERRANAAGPATAVGAPAVLRRYQELFGTRLSPAKLAVQQLGDLLLLFEAASLTGNQHPDSRTVDDMRAVHREFTARGIDTRRMLDDDVLYAMLAARRFEQARAFAAVRPHLADTPIPQVVDPLGPGFKGRSALTYDGARNTLTRLAMPFSSGTELLMVVGPCHNSDKALQAIHEDAALQARLRGANLVLVTMPTAPIDTHLITEWNAANPTMPIRAPYSAEEWKAIEVTGIPSFYLLRNGKVVDQRTGWPAEGKAELMKLIVEAAN